MGGGGGGEGGGGVVGAVKIGSLFKHLIAPILSSIFMLGKCYKISLKGETNTSPFLKLNTYN